MAPLRPGEAADLARRRKLADRSASVVFVIALVVGLVAVLLPLDSLNPRRIDRHPLTPRTATTETTVETLVGAKITRQTRTIVQQDASESFIEATLGLTGLVLVRIATALLLAVILAAITQRVILGAYGFKLAGFELPELPGAGESAKLVQALVARLERLESTTARTMQVSAITARRLAEVETREGKRGRFRVRRRSRGDSVERRA